ncbi:hypothetical protein [Amycolatopsis alkalitolerans]|uniref:hypothetical protein n=1 Tax=Amycolatopsis alkalitolerans TaxID=2547244 RepID=UPI0013575B63|nr:hypothetical protein [Amycolatopsis alkalitolerans]
MYHAHLKDVETRDRELAIAGVLDPRPFTDPQSRAWNLRTIGHGHSAAFRSSFLGSLREVGCDDVVSIENEDPFLPEETGAIEAADCIIDLLNANQPFLKRGS